MLPRLQILSMLLYLPNSTPHTPQAQSTSPVQSSNLNLTHDPSNRPSITHLCFINHTLPMPLPMPCHAMPCPVFSSSSPHLVPSHLAVQPAYSVGLIWSGLVWRLAGMWCNNPKQPEIGGGNSAKRHNAMLCHVCHGLLPIWPTLLF